MRLWLSTHARATSIAAIAAVIVLGAGYLGWALLQRTAQAPFGRAAGDVTVVELADGRNDVQQVRLADPRGPRATMPLSCLRYYSAAGTSICMKISGVGPSYAADILGPDGRLIRSIGLPGIPSRARVSASGAIVTWTSFVTGDSYSVPGGFSTRTGFMDVRTGEVQESIELFTTTVDGMTITAADRNYWGLTVGADDRTVYATLASGAKTWLVRGDLAARTMTAVRPGAECPSVSPDGTRVAYKKRVSRLGPWDLAVLDLASGLEVRLPGTEGIDDQAEWLDDSRLAYGAVPRDGRVSAIFVVPADGSGPSRLVIPDAASPSAHR